jgi:hypothetical protein
VGTTLGNFWGAVTFCDTVFGRDVRVFGTDSRLFGNQRSDLEKGAVLALLLYFTFYLLDRPYRIPKILLGIG